MALSFFGGQSGGGNRVSAGVRKRTRAQAQPGFLQNLVSQFNPFFQGLLLPQLQQGLSQARSGLARRGLTGTGFGQATLAGIPAFFQFQSLLAALSQANTTQQRLISTELGAPLPQPSQGLLPAALGGIIGGSASFGGGGAGAGAGGGAAGGSSQIAGTAAFIG